MDLLKKVIKKYMPLSTGMFIALVAMLAITSCGMCSKSGKDQTGKIELSIDKNTYIGDNDREVELTAHLASGDTDKEAIIQNFKLKISATEILATGATGGSRVSYIEPGTTNKKYITAGTNGETENLDKIFNLNGKDTLTANDTEELKAIFKIRPVRGANQVVVQFEVLDENDVLVGSPCVATWKKAAGPAYTLETTGLKAGDIIPATNKFSIEIANQTGGDIEAKEIGDFTVNVTVDGDATIAGIKDNKLTFELSNINAGRLVKEIEVVPVNQTTEFKLELQHKGVTVATKTVKLNVIPVGTYTLAVGKNKNKNKIEDGSTAIEVIVGVVGNADLKKEDLETLSLKIQRNKGTVATIQDANATGVEAEFSYAFTGANEFTITDNKTATKQLTIIPGTDREASFVLTLLDKDKKAITGAEQTIEWSNGIDVQVVTLEYRTIDGAVVYEIKNNGQAPTVDEVELSWERVDGKEVEVNKAPSGNINLDLKGTDIKHDRLEVTWGNDIAAAFRFIVKCNGEEVLNKELHFVKKAPAITVALSDTTKTEFIGQGEKKVNLTIVAGARLSDAELKYATLVYTSTDGCRLLDAKGDDVQNKDLNTLLGISSLKAAGKQELVLTIDNNNHEQATFTDIKIKGSQDEDKAENKVAQIEWKEDLQVLLVNTKIGEVENIVNEINSELGKDLPDYNKAEKIAAEAVKAAQEAIDAAALIKDDNTDKLDFVVKANNAKDLAEDMLKLARVHVKVENMGNITAAVEGELEKDNLQDNDLEKIREEIDKADKEADQLITDVNNEVFKDTSIKDKALAQANEFKSLVDDFKKAIEVYAKTNSVKDILAQADKEIDSSDLDKAINTVKEANEAAAKALNDSEGIKYVKMKAESKKKAEGAKLLVNDKLHLVMAYNKARGVETKLVEAIGKRTNVEEANKALDEADKAADEALNEAGRIGDAKMQADATKKADEAKNLVKVYLNNKEVTEKLAEFSANIDADLNKAMEALLKARELVVNSELLIDKLPNESKAAIENIIGENLKQVNEATRDYNKKLGKDEQDKKLELLLNKK